MTSTGTTVVQYAAKKKMRLGAHYDQNVALAAVTLDGDIHSTTYLTIPELQKLHARIGHVLEQAIEAQGIGFDAYSTQLDRDLTRLERDIQPRTDRKRKRSTPFLEGTPPADTPREEIDRLAAVEIQKVKDAKARGDYR